MVHARVGFGVCLMALASASGAYAQDNTRNLGRSIAWQAKHDGTPYMISGKVLRGGDHVARLVPMSSQPGHPD